MKSKVFAYLDSAKQDRQYQEYRRRLDARKVLDHYGVENDREEVTASGEVEVIHSCLLDRVDRHHNNGDANPSASCNIDRKLYICYSFWGGDLFHLIQKMENKSSFSEIVPLLSPFLSESALDNDDWTRVSQKMLADLVSPGAYSISIPSYSERILTPWAFVHPYLHERGIDSQTASDYQIGWREDDNRIIIPHFWKGNLVGWQARSIPERPGQWPGSPVSFPKYKSTSGFPKSDTLFYNHSRGPWKSGGSVVVVESPMSVIKATALGLEVPVVATFGAKVSQTQMSILADFDHLIVWPDPDPAGDLMARKVVSSLHRMCSVEVVTPDDDRDLGDHTSLDDVAARIESAQTAVEFLSERGGL